MLALLLAAAAPAREVAITIDDFPRGGDVPGACDFTAVRSITAKLLAPFATNHLPVIGFVNEGRCAIWTQRELRSILELWLRAGADLGNHTYSHADLNTTPLAAYEQDVLRGAAVTRRILREHHRRLRYFRHPFLRTGLTLETKDELYAFLTEHGYRVAPVTFDNSDYMFAAVYGHALANGDSALAGRVQQAYLPYLESIVRFFEDRALEVAGRAIPQILLIHASALNAEMMPLLLEMLKSRGYRFVTLDRALADPAYLLPDRYAGPGGFSWIHRWSITKGMQPKGEPDEPAFVTTEYRKLR